MLGQADPELPDLLLDGCHLLADDLDLKGQFLRRQVVRVGYLP